MAPKSEVTGRIALGDPPTAAHLGAAIRALRVERELTIERLAGKAEVHWTYLSGIERGLRNPSWKVLTSVSRSLEVRTAEIVQRAEAEANSEGSDRKPR